MATNANVIEAFEDLGFNIEDPKAIDRLVIKFNFYRKQFLYYSLLGRGLLSVNLHELGKMLLLAVQIYSNWLFCLYLKHLKLKPKVKEHFGRIGPFPSV